MIFVLIIWLLNHFLIRIVSNQVIWCIWYLLVFKYEQIVYLKCFLVSLVFGLTDWLWDIDFLLDSLVWTASSWSVTLSLWPWDRGRGFSTSLLVLGNQWPIDIRCHWPTLGDIKRSVWIDIIKADPLITTHNRMYILNRCCLIHIKHRLPSIYSWALFSFAFFLVRLCLV